jgi:hypothetical protein
MWWTRISQQQKDEASKLIKNGQVEFAQGGWVSPDEDTTNYEDFILNMQLG